MPDFGARSCGTDPPNNIVIIITMVLTLNIIEKNYSSSSLFSEYRKGREKLLWDDTKNMIDVSVQILVDVLISTKQTLFTVVLAFG